MEELGSDEVGEVLFEDKWDNPNTSEGNYTNTTTMILGYSTLHIIISSIILTFMMIVVVIGNMLVIIAIATEKTLKNIQNWFIASLAVADFFVGLLIMPFSLANELMGYWIFGSVWCSIHSAMDVLLCTSSIMNICLISLDRYWSITQAVDYLKKRTPVRAAVMIGMVWALSALISIPPLLGWRDADSLMDQPFPTCQLSRQIGYVLYSALGSFYIPSCIMVFVYIRIYFAARARARRGVKKPPRLKKTEPSRAPSRPPSTPTTKGPELSPTQPPAQIPSSLKGLNSLESPDPRAPKIVGFQDPLVHDDELVRPEITVESCSPENSAEGSSKHHPHEDTEDSEEQRSSESGEAPPPLLPTVHLREVEEPPKPVPPKEKGTKKGKRPKLHFLRVEAPTIWRTSSSLSLNGDVHILGTLSRSCSRLQVDADPISDVEPSSSDSGAVSRCAVVKPLKLRLCQPFFGKRGSESRKARRDVLDMGKINSPKTKVAEVAPPQVSPTKVPHQPFDPEREKRRIARKKEKRATLILGLIMGSFILCWLPFFFLYILEPLCTSCQVAPWGFAIAFWLGYMNSALNPVIYTIFNKDFRRAFRRILFK